MWVWLFAYSIKSESFEGKKLQVVNFREFLFSILSFSPKIHLCSCSTIEKKCEIGSQLLPGHNFNIYSRMVFPTWWEGGEGTKGIVNSNRQKSGWSFSCRRRGMYILWNQTIYEVAYIIWFFSTHFLIQVF